MHGRIAPGPRPAALLIALLIALGIVAAGPAGGASNETDLVRVVVQFDEPSLAKYRDTGSIKGVLKARTDKGHLDVTAPASRAYLAHLAGKHAEFEEKIKGASPNAAVHWRYDTALNGLAVQVPRDQLDAIRRLPGVKSVTETYELEPELDESANLLGLQSLWAAAPSSPLGAGYGLRLALIDSGVNAQHPFFSDGGYTAPAGYPKAERVSGGVRTPVPLATYANNKVIVGNVYAYPGNTTATPWGAGSQHATHVAGIMAGRQGTYPYSSGGATFNLTFSGMAPGAYIMSYRLDGDSAEFIAAIEDVVADQADALNISLGHSRWLTNDPANDHVRAALDAAVDAGVVVAGSSGNAGTNGDSSVTGSWKMSEKVLAVANSSHRRVFSNAVTVTGPGPVPESLTKRVSVPGAAPTPPITSNLAGEYVVAPGGTDGNAGLACDPLPAGSLTGKILLAYRGNCNFDVKKNNARDAGAIAYVLATNGPDAPSTMGGITAPAIPGVMVTQADGKALVAWAAGKTAPTLAIEGPVQRLTSGWPDVMAASSSKGPTPFMGIKPDIAAPGSNILSSSVGASGAVNPAALFEQLTGTSMSTPHVTALAGLVKSLHPDWTPAEIKSALMNTASTSMWLDINGTVPALAKHRGGGRVNAARLANVQLTFAPQSVSFGLMRAGEAKTATITATDMRASGGASAYTVSTRAVVGSPEVTLAAQSFTSSPDGSSTFTVSLSTGAAPAGDYEGFVEVTGGGQTYTIPYFVRVQNPAVVKDVLLIDWDRNLGGVDYQPVYTAALTGLGLTFDVFNGGLAATLNGNAGPTYAQLQNYRAVVMFTGNNPVEWAAAHTGGTFMLQDYLLAGGKLLVTGQNVNSQWADNQNVGSDNLLAYMSGWITGNQFVPGTTAPCPTVQSDRDFYGSGANAPTATTQLETAFTLLGQTGDVSVNLGGTGAGNQTAPDAGRPIVASDAFDRCTEAHNAAQAAPHARVLGSYTTTKKAGVMVNRLTNGVATGIAPDATLENLDPNLSWAAAYVHVGLEGLNANRGELSPQTALGRLHDFLTDSVSVAVRHKVTADRVQFVAQASSTKSTITKYRWDFGDGSPIVETTSPTVLHEYGKGSRGTYTANVEAVDGLTRTGVASASVRIIRR